jgi:enoyl-CoA hydratase
MDLKEAAQSPDRQPGPARHDHYAYVQKHDKVVIAAIHGICVAGGFLMALGCDVRLCSGSARFGNPQVRHGLPSKAGLLMQRAGVPRAVMMDMMLSGEQIDARRAFEIGLVSRICPDRDSLLDEAVRLAETICNNAPGTVTGIRRADRAGIFDMPYGLAMPAFMEITGQPSDYEESRNRINTWADKNS